MIIYIRKPTDNDLEEKQYDFWRIIERVTA